MTTEIAFKNALLFYSKNNYFKQYQPPTEEEESLEESFEKIEYHTTDWDQKPHTYHVFPLITRLYMDNEFFGELFDINGYNDQNFFSDTEDSNNVTRYKFTFLYNIDRAFDKKTKDMIIDKRFVRDLIRRLIALKLNKIGIYTRQFYSEDMKRIFMVLKSQPNVLKTRAEVSFYSTN